MYRQKLVMACFSALIAPALNTSELDSRLEDVDFNGCSPEDKCKAGGTVGFGDYVRHKAEAVPRLIRKRLIDTEDKKTLEIKMENVPGLVHAMTEEDKREYKESKAITLSGTFDVYNPDAKGTADDPRV